MYQPISEQWNQLVVNDAGREINYQQHIHRDDDSSVKPSNDVSLSGKRCNTATIENIAHKKVKTDKECHSLQNGEILMSELGVRLREPVKDEIESLFDKSKIRISDAYEKECVIYGNSSTVYGLLQDKERLSNGCHGVIIDTSGDIRISSQQTYRCNYEYTYTEESKLDAGAFGAVDVRSKKKFILKQMKKSLFEDKEVEFMLKLNHVNITRCLGVIVSGLHIQLLQSYSGKSLEVLVLVDKVKFSEDDNIQLSIQALSALSYMHKLSIMHMDIKPGNVCVERMTLRLIDFGSCQLQQESLTFKGWTPEYMSGELCQHLSQRFKNNVAQISGKTDVYSWGLTMCFIHHGEHVMLKYKWEEGVRKTSRLGIVRQIAGHPNFMASVVDDSITPDLKSMIRDLLNGDVRKRLTAQEGKTSLEEIRQEREKSKTSGAEFNVKHVAHENINKRLEHISQAQQPDEPVPETSQPPIDVPIEPTRNIPNFNLLLSDPD